MDSQILKEKLTSLRIERDMIDFHIDTIINPYLPEEPHYFKISSWECEVSPFGLCAYHKILDPAWDDCIFCHQPFERK